MNRSVEWLFSVGLESPDMSRTVLGALAAVALGAAAAVAGAQFVGDPLFAGTVGLCVAVSVGLLVYIHREYPHRTTGDSWADERWTGLSVGVVNLAALVGLAVVEPSAEALAGAQVLVILAGLVGYLAGSLAEMEREATAGDERPEATPADD